MPHLLRREEGVEDPLLEPLRDAGARIGTRQVDGPLPDGAGDMHDLARRLRHRVPSVRQQVDQHLLQLDGVADHHRLRRAQVQLDLDLVEAELLVHEREGLLDHLVHRHRLAAHRRHAPERAQVRDDLGGLAHLLHGVAQLPHDPPRVLHPELDEVDRVAHEQPDVVQRIVEFVGDPGREFSERGELAGLDELLLLVAQLLLAALDLGGGLPQVAHDVDHGLAAHLQAEVGGVGVLQNVQQGAPRVVEALGLATEPPAVLLVVAEDVERGLAPVAQAFVELVEVAHDVEHGAALLVALLEADRQQPHLLAQPCLRLDPAVQLRRLPRALARHGSPVGRRQARSPSPLSRATSFRKPSRSFSRAIILSSRPTTTSSNFSRSRIFSCNSVLDFSRSRTTCS